MLQQILIVFLLAMQPTINAEIHRAQNLYEQDEQETEALTRLPQAINVIIDKCRINTAVDPLHQKQDLHVWNTCDFFKVRAIYGNICREVTVKIFPYNDTFNEDQKVNFIKDMIKDLSTTLHKHKLNDVTIKLMLSTTPSCTIEQKICPEAKKALRDVALGNFNNETNEPEDCIDEATIIINFTTQQQPI